GNRITHKNLHSIRNGFDLRNSLDTEEYSRTESHRDKAMMAHSCVSACHHLRTCCFPPGLSRPSGLAGILRAAEPFWVQVSRECGLCEVGWRAHSSRLSLHYLKFFPSESQGSVPIGKTLCAVLCRRGSTRHHVRRLARCGPPDE